MSRLCEICNSVNSDPNQKFCTRKCKLVKIERNKPKYKAFLSKQERALESIGAPEWHKGYDQFGDGDNL